MKWSKKKYSLSSTASTVSNDERTYIFHLADDQANNLVQLLQQQENRIKELEIEKLNYQWQVLNEQVTNPQLDN